MSGDPQTYAIIGAAMEVHATFGNGYAERVYQLALAKEFEKRGIPFLREAEIPIYYKGEALDVTYKADFVCYEDIIVELKAVTEVTNVFRAQTLNYLKATGFQRALLINFGEESLAYERFANKWDK